jgi:hypothetical protein
MNEPAPMNSSGDPQLPGKNPFPKGKAELRTVRPPTGERGSKREVFFRKVLPRTTGGSAAGLLVICALLTGCSTPHQYSEAPGSQSNPYNVYSTGHALPADLKRVALLPLVTDGRYGEMIDGCETLDPVLNAELIKTKRFEVARVTSQGLKDCTGQSGWSGDEALPPEFFSAMHEAYGCDAVLFCQLTEFRPYAPLAIGWRLKLVDVRTRQVVWAGDEIFDNATAPVVPRSAYRYWFYPTVCQNDSNWITENSPRRFAQYTVDQLLATLPER